MLPEGRTRRLQCPYHAWSYGFDGALKNAPFTEGLEDFDPACFGLHAVRLAVVEGLVLLDLAGDAPPPQAHIGDLADSLAAYRLPGAAPRRPDRLRRRRQLEGDRRELQRVPALPRRASGAQPALALPVGRDDHRRRSLVRRLDDAGRGRGDDGDRRRPRPQADRGRRPALDPLLPRLPEHADLAAPGLRDAAHAVAALARPHRGGVRVVLRAWGDRPRRLRSHRCRRLLGPGQPRGLAGVRAHAAGPGVARRSSPAATRPRRATCTSSTGWWRAATWRRSDELRRDRRRRRSQRPHRGRLPRPGRAGRVRAGAPRTCSAERA